MCLIMAINDLCSVHWADFAFDGYSCHPQHIKCISESTPMYSDHNDVESFLRCPLRDIKPAKFKDIKEEMKMMLKHVQGTEMKSF